MVTEFRLEAKGFLPRGMPWRLLQSHHPVLLPYTPGSVPHCSCRKIRESPPLGNNLYPIMTFRDFWEINSWPKGSSSSVLSLLNREESRGTLQTRQLWLSYFPNSPSKTNFSFLGSPSSPHHLSSCQW